MWPTPESFEGPGCARTPAAHTFPPKSGRTDCTNRPHAAMVALAASLHGLSSPVAATRPLPGPRRRRGGRVGWLDSARPDAAGTRVCGRVEDRRDYIEADVLDPAGWTGRVAELGITHIVHGATITSIAGAGDSSRSLW